MELILNEIKSKIERFTTYIDNNIGVEFGEHSCAYTDSNDIVVGLYATLYRKNIVDLAHLRYYNENGFDYVLNIVNYETFVILHEIGHLQTPPTKKESKAYDKAQKKIAKSKMTDYDKLLAYWTLPLEIRADNWAKNFVEKNPQLCEWFDNSIHELKNKLLKSLN